MLKQNRGKQYGRLSDHKLEIIEKIWQKKKITTKKILGLSAIAVLAVIVGTQSFASAATAANINLPFSYNFSYPGQLEQAQTIDQSSSPYFWLKYGGRVKIANGVGSTITGSVPATDTWYKVYSKMDLVEFDNGSHPQNRFFMLMRNSGSETDTSSQVYLNHLASNLSNIKNVHEYNAESLVVRYQDDNNYYFASIRTDGYLTLRKKVGGVYKTLASKKVLAGSFNPTSAPDLIPTNKWIGLKVTVINSSTSMPTLTVYTDIGRTGTWRMELSATDDPAVYGQSIANAGLVGIKSDYSDMQFDDLIVTKLSNATSNLNPATTTPAIPIPSVPSANSSSYDSVVLSHNPSVFLGMTSSPTGNEKDLSGKGHNGVYKGGFPAQVKLPNGDLAAQFNGATQYLTVPSSPDMSIATTKTLTWEAWIRPDTLQFSNASSDGYIDWMGKCQDYSPTCEWEARMYSTVTSQNRPSRISAYVFNNSAGLGSAADWQPSSTNVIQAGQWIHVVAEYQITSTPNGCNSAYPGSINIWVNGVKQNFGSHFPTGCISQYSVTPKSSNSPLNIGTMALDTWFKGAVGKVAIYNRLLTQTEIEQHYTAMTGKPVTGSCGATCSF